MEVFVPLYLLPQRGTQKMGTVPRGSVKDLKIKDLGTLKTFLVGNYTTIRDRYMLTRWEHIWNQQIKWE